MTHDHDRAGCRAFRELAVWLPTDALTRQERRRLEDHLAGCPDCRRLADDATLLCERLRKAADHPDPDELVAFADDDPQLPDAARDRVREHLPACASCGEVLRILRRVNDDLLLGPAAVLGRTGQAATRRPRGRIVRRLWPAVAATAAAAALLLLQRPPTPTVGGVHLLSGGGSAVRGPRSEETEQAVLLDSTDRQILVLEFSDLAAPPAVDDLYRVAISGADGTTVWRQDVRGGLFRENYTLALILPAGTLDPGDYLLAVESPDAATILRSRFAVD